MMHVDFGTATELVRTFSLPAGAARVSSGVLRLTAADMLQTGSAVMMIPAASSAGEFAVEFDAYLGGGSGGEGLSFSFGALPPTYFGEHGVRSALSIQLLSAARRVEVWHAHSLLAQSVGTVELRRGRFTTVAVTHGMEGLSVAIDRAVVVENVTLAGWTPSANWSIGFGARTGETNYDIHLIDNVRVRTGAAFRSRTVPVEVSINGQENTSNAIGFSYFAEPTVSYLRFERGPTSGGTSVAIGGSSFRGGSVFVCRFGAHAVNATYSASHDELSCVSPAATAGAVPVEISLNGQQFTTSGVKFTSYSEASVSYLVPSAGPRQGGTAITVFGAGFSHGLDYRCRFHGDAGPAAVVVASMVDDGRLVCSTPAPRCGSGSCAEVVEVSLNSESYSTSGVRFTYHNATVRSLSVVSGPSSGGTTVTVHGTGFMQMSRVETECRFSHGSVVASFIDDTKLLCVSPTAISAGVSLHRDREVLLTSYKLPSASRSQLPALSSSVFPLIAPLSATATTIPGVLEFGHLRSLVADPRAFHDFTVAFSLNISKPAVDGGETVSFCAGQQVSMFPARGLADGFCVTFIHDAASCRLDLHEGGKRLSNADLVCAFGIWHEVHVTLVNGSLSVYHDGHMAVRGAALTRWAPTKAFEVGFASRRSSVLADQHNWLRGARIVAGSLLVEAEANVEVSLNGIEFTSDRVPFTYLSEPHLAAITPSAGPTDGGTLVAIRVKAPPAFSRATNLRCRFSLASTPTVATWHSGEGLLRCRTPPAQGGGRVVTTLSMTVDGFSLNDGDGVLFTYYVPPVLESVAPDSGPVNGATDIIIRGMHLSLGVLAPYFCRFGNDTVPATAELRSAGWRCTTPRSVDGARTVPVEISLNGQQFHHVNSTLAAQNVGTFGFYDPPQVMSMSPSSGTVLGQTAVTIFGSGFVRAFANHCRWGNLTTRVTNLNATQITCPTPRMPVGRKPVELTMNGQQYTSDNRSFSFYLDPHVHRLGVPGTEAELGSWLDPKVTMPRAGYTMVRVWGSGFMGGTDYRCRINGAAESIAATYDASLDCLLCWSNKWLDGVNNAVEVSLNGREFTKDNVTAFMNFFW